MLKKAITEKLEIEKKIVKKVFYSPVNKIMLAPQSFKLLMPEIKITSETFSGVIDYGVPEINFTKLIASTSYSLSFRS